VFGFAAATGGPGVPQIGHETELGIGDIGHQIAGGMGIIDHLGIDLPAAILDAPFVSDLDHPGRHGPLRLVDIQALGRGQHFAEAGAVALADHDARTFGEVGPQASGMVDMVMVSTR
jgi:hypothetical protein